MTDAAGTLVEVTRTLLSALESLTFAQRHLHPALLTKLGEHIGKYEERLVAAHAIVRAENASAASTALDTAFELTLRAVRALPLAGQDPNGVYAAYRALRYVPYAHEALYIPKGAVSRRWVSNESSTRSRKTISRMRPLPPGCVPLPPDSGRT